MEVITLFSPAKINLYLKILGRDGVTGFHYLDMLMVPVSLADKIEIMEAEQFAIRTLQIEEHIPTEKNIIYKIHTQTVRATGKNLPSFDVAIYKNTPTGGGMGGGSSNGAAFLKFLNTHCGLGLTIAQMVEIARTVGSDIPFFLYDSPAIVRGFGEQVIPVKLHSFFSHILIIAPQAAVNTKEAYALYDKNNLTKPIEININTDRVSEYRSLKEWVDFVHNDFEQVVFGMVPELNDIKFSLEHAGADKAFMTGSGSVMVGLFSDESACIKACAAFTKKYSFVRMIKVLI